MRRRNSLAPPKFAQAAHTVCSRTHSADLGNILQCSGTTLLEEDDDDKFAFLKSLPRGDAQCGRTMQFNSH